MKCLKIQRQKAIIKPVPTPKIITHPLYLLMILNFGLQRCLPVSKKRPNKLKKMDKFASNLPHSMSQRFIPQNITPKRLKIAWGTHHKWTIQSETSSTLLLCVQKRKFLLKRLRLIWKSKRCRNPLRLKDRSISYLSSQWLWWKEKKWKSGLSSKKYLMKWSIVTSLQFETNWQTGQWIFLLTSTASFKEASSPRTTRCMNSKYLLKDCTVIGTMKILRN